MEFRNYVQLIGNLGADPVIRDTKNGKVARFSLATTEYHRENGKMVSKTEWHIVVAWNSNAEIVERKCTKGSSVTVLGKLTSRSYEDQSKVKRYVTEIVVNEIICHERAEKVASIDEKPFN